MLWLKVWHAKMFVFFAHTFVLIQAPILHTRPTFLLKKEELNYVLLFTFSATAVLQPFYFPPTDP